MIKLTPGLLTIGQRQFEVHGKPGPSFRAVDLVKQAISKADNQPSEVTKQQVSPSPHNLAQK